jgi:hypothetical protein
MPMHIVIGVIGGGFRTIARLAHPITGCMPSFLPQHFGIARHASQIVRQFFARRSCHDPSSLPVTGVS